MIDANQRWDVGDADRLVRSLAAFARTGSRNRPAPTTSWATRPSRGPRRRSRRHRRALREPGHLQAAAAGDALGICQIDACRLAGVNEVIAVLLLAAKFGVPVCPHAGGVGLCEYVQHLVVLRLHRGQRIAGGADDRVRRPPARALHRPGRRSPTGATGCRPLPGYSVELRPASIAEFRSRTARPGREAVRPDHPGQAGVDRGV